MSNLETLTQKRLDLQVEIAARRDELRKLTAAIDAEAARIEAEKKMERMSDTEKAALLQVLQPPGIASKGKVGTPGGTQ